jgi:hypothetical protein
VGGAIAKILDFLIDAFATVFGGIFKYIGTFISFLGELLSTNNLVGEGTEIFSVGNADSNVRVVNNIYAQSFYDITNTAYYLDPASTTLSLKTRGYINITHSMCYIK